MGKYRKIKDKFIAEANTLDFTLLNDIYKQVGFIFKCDDGRVVDIAREKAQDFKPKVNF